MSRQPVYADGGEMTKQQMLAAYGWGPWSVQWPSQMPDEAKKELDPGDGNSWGFVYRIRRTPGRHGRRFARADMSIVAADFPPNSSVPIPGSGFSDVEASLDELEQRTLGDVFFEKEITRSGLGPLVPYRDFDVGDRWDLVIWGLRMAGLPVTSISEVTELGEVVGWRLVFGGQLVADNAANRRVQDELGRQIEAQKREQRQEAQRAAEENARKIKLERTERENAMIAQRQYIDNDFRTGVLDTADKSSRSYTDAQIAKRPWGDEVRQALSAASRAQSTAENASSAAYSLNEQRKSQISQVQDSLQRQLWTQQSRIDDAQNTAIAANTAASRANTTAVGVQQDVISRLERQWTRFWTFGDGMTRGVIGGRTFVEFGVVDEYFKVVAYEGYPIDYGVVCHVEALNNYTVFYSGSLAGGERKLHGESIARRITRGLFIMQPRW